MQQGLVGNCITGGYCMTKAKTFTVVGGDLRQAQMANTLAGRQIGYNIYGMFLEKDVKLSRKITQSRDVQLILPQSDIVVFPLPMMDSTGRINTPLSEDSITLEECLDYIACDTVVLAGMVPTWAREKAFERGIELLDYYEREEFAILNSVPTAEGAIQIALEELPITLFGSTCLITGYGRISKALAKLLCAFGADVRVVARKHSDLAWIKIYGCTPVHISELGNHLKDADVLFNTVPAMILGEEKLSRLSRHSLVIDLASKPGGVDFEMAKNLGLKVIWALSLP